MAKLELHLADQRGLQVAQYLVKQHHYLHAPVDVRCSPLAFLLAEGGITAGILIFGRPESTRCYDGGLTYGSVEDKQAGRCQYTR